LRRILSILLFGLLLLNMTGYSVVYLLENKYDIHMGNDNFIEKKSYSNDIIIKVPVSLPYQANWDYAEPAEGKIRHAGEYYQMKTRQLINDTLYVHCEFDQNARDRFMTLVSHINEEISGTHADAHKKSPSNILKSFLKDYMSCKKSHVFYLMEWLEQRVYTADHYLFISSKTYLSIPSPPPDLV
jgi:hypothetical protein